MTFDKSLLQRLPRPAPCMSRPLPAVCRLAQRARQRDGL
nr:MAG TPA: hypothetical protein [Caudoviricetes sp.]DAZ54339.1 MAG TPA: hypothetical protein [Caudoviricetes sp.]